MLSESGEAKMLQLFTVLTLTLSYLVVRVAHPPPAERVS